ncbi:MAG: type II secretion system protein [Trichlorobacter sp.]|nr:type II secretion system protein [Trichlorobacter sp.]
MKFGNPYKIYKRLPANHNLLQHIVNRKQQSGFTLVELLVALFIVSIGFLAVLPVLLSSMDLTKSTDSGIKAKEMAVQKIEELMAMPKNYFDDDLKLLTNNEFTSATEYFDDKIQPILIEAAQNRALFERQFNVQKVSGVTTEPIPLVLTSVVRYKHKGMWKSRSFSMIWSF